MRVGAAIGFDRDRQKGSRAGVTRAVFAFDDDPLVGREHCPHEAGPGGVEDDAGLGLEGEVGIGPHGAQPPRVARGAPVAQRHRAHPAPQDKAGQPGRRRRRGLQAQGVRDGDFARAAVDLGAVTGGQAGAGRRRPDQRDTGRDAVLAAFARAERPLPAHGFAGRKILLPFAARVDVEADAVQARDRGDGIAGRAGDGDGAGLDLVAVDLDGGDVTVADRFERNADDVRVAQAHVGRPFELDIARFETGAGVGGPGGWRDLALRCRGRKNRRRRGRRGCGRSGRRGRGLGGGARRTYRSVETGRTGCWRGGRRADDFRNIGGPGILGGLGRFGRVGGFGWRGCGRGLGRLDLLSGRGRRRRAAGSQSQTHEGQGNALEA